MTGQSAHGRSSFAGRTGEGLRDAHPLRGDGARHHEIGVVEVPSLGHDQAKLLGVADDPIARGLVEAQGGRVWAENAPQGGARVSFSLPVATG